MLSASSCCNARSESQSSCSAGDKMRRAKADGRRRAAKSAMRRKSRMSVPTPMMRISSHARLIATSRA